MLYEIVEHTLIRIKVAQFFFKKRHAKLFWILIKRLQLYMCIKLSKKNSDQEYLITSTKTILNLKIIVVVKNKINILR